MKAILSKGLYLLWSCLFYISIDAQNTTLPSLSAQEILADRQTETMHKAVTLEPEQMEKVKNINLKYAKLMEDARTQGLKLAELHETKLSEFQEVLTSEQYQKWIEIKKNWLDTVKKDQMLPDIQTGFSFD